MKKNRRILIVLQQSIANRLLLLARLILLPSVFFQLFFFSSAYAQDQQAIYKYLGVEYSSLAEAEMRKPRTNDSKFESFARGDLKLE